MDRVEEVPVHLGARDPQPREPVELPVQGQRPDEVAPLLAVDQHSFTVAAAPDGAPPHAAGDIAGREGREPVPELGAARGREGQPLLHRLPSRLERERHAGEELRLGKLRPFLDEPRQAARVLPQPLLAVRREGKEPLPGGCGRRPARHELLQDEVGVRPAEAEGADAGPPHQPPGPVHRGRPLPGARDHVERAPREVDERVQLPEVKGGREEAVAEREEDLEDSRDPRGRFEVADVRLHRAEAAGGLPRGLLSAPAEEL